VTLAKKCEVFSIEFVVRGYITGSTSTSLWTVYNNGDREYCGNILSEGLKKNQKLEANMLTPTTKEEHHDRPIAPPDIVSEGWMTQEDWDYCSQKALALFAFGQQKAAEHGLILVDTKYEMGRDTDGTIRLIDEIHTPDSSRYWVAETYDERMSAGQEPQNIDKEFLRLWFVDNCDPYNDKTLPDAPDELVAELSSRYIYLYETITGKAFPFPDTGKPIQERINENLKDVL
jgi:phosphoribosylaminoimidazole-succinocarboxamide synthase